MDPTFEVPADLTWDVLRERINRLALRDGHYAGYPFPASLAKLVLEPGTPHKNLQGMKFDGPDDSEDDPDQRAAPPWEFEAINSWYSYKLGCRVWIVREFGLFSAIKEPRAEIQKLNFWLRSAIVAEQTMNVTAELTAQETLREHVNETQWRSYILAGTFIETSKRSGVKYIFRKLRPTVAIREVGDGFRCLAVLCLHPLGYYQETWCGTLAPTDDVLSHLLLMRGDERKYWAKAEHHRPWETESGM